MSSFRSVLVVLIAWCAALGCSEIFNSSDLDDGSVRVLAKAEGWRDGLDTAFRYFAVLEIAPDEDISEMAWRENVPDSLPAGRKAGPGIYGDLDEVDFGRQTIVVWSSGESGSCADWLVDLHTTDGTVEVELEQRQGICTSDYNAYRLVLAVDRDRLFDLGSLPSEGIVGVPDGIVAVYPYEPVDMK